MKLKELKIILSSLKGFDIPKIQYEQYVTPADLSATMIHTIDTVYGDIKNRTILDLCGGTGMLWITCTFYDPLMVVNVDIDEDVLQICKENMELVNKHVDMIHSDFQCLKFNEVFDTCVMNPPFGMRCKGLDVLAINFAIKHSRVCYVLHSSKTKDYYLKKFGNIEVIATMKYDLPCSYTFHKKTKKTIDVDLYRIINKTNHI